MIKRDRHKLITFISAFYTENKDRSVADCINALKAARLDPGAGLVRSIRAKVVSAKGGTPIDPSERLAPETVEFLKDNPTARAAAIRTVIVGLGPDSGIKEILRQCHLHKVAATRDEAIAARTQVRKSRIDAIVTIEKSAVRLVEHLSEDLELEGNEAHAYLDGVRNEIMYEKALVAPTPSTFTQKVDTAAVRASIEAEQARKEAVRTEREARMKERTTAKEKQWAKDRREEALTATTPPTPVPDEVKASTGELPDAIAHRFSNKMNGACATTAELPPELAAGKQDNAEGRSIRLRWAEDFILQQPQMHSGDAQLALQATFGIGLNSAVVQDILKTVRELNGMRYITRKRIDVPSGAEGAPVVVEVPRKATPLPPETKMLIEWTSPPPGPPSIATTRTTLGGLEYSLTKLANEGVKLDTVSVYRQIKISHTTVTTVTVLAEVEED